MRTLGHEHVSSHAAQKTLGRAVLGLEYHTPGIRLWATSCVHVREVGSWSPALHSGCTISLLLPEFSMTVLLAPSLLGGQKPHNLSFFFFLNCASLFYCYYYFGYSRSSFLQVGFSLVAWVRATLSAARASHCGGFSCGAQALDARASVVAPHRLSSCGSWALELKSFSSCSSWPLERGFSTCGTQAESLCSM